MKKKTTATKTKKVATGERGLPLWPRGKPLPKFKTAAEEAAWWESHDVEPGEQWEQVSYEPRATVQPREHVYRIRFSDEEMALLQSLAKRRGVSASVIIRELVMAQAPRR